MNDLQRRAAATKATEARFYDKPFNWAGAATCVHLMRYHAAQMGHSMPVVPKFRSPLSAKRALKQAGFESMEAMMDSMFARIAPAFMMTGDVMALPGDAGFSSLLIRGSVNKFLGWHEDAPGCCILLADMAHATGAWRL